MPLSRPPGAHLALYLGLSLALAGFHALEIDFGPKKERAMERHEQILTADGEAPWGYRIFAPALAEQTRFLRGADGVAASYVLWRFLATFFTLVAFEIWLRAWLEPAWALAGTLLLAALTPLTFGFYWYQPDSPIDLLVWVGAAVATVARRDALLFPIVGLGALNRETAVFAIVIHGALRWGDEGRRPLLLRLAGLFALWLAVFVALRLWLGPLEATVSLEELARQKLRPVWWVWAVAFAGVWVILAFVGWSRRPAALRRLWLALLVLYLPLPLVFGRLQEVRLLLPLTLGALPLVLMALRESDPGRSA